MLHAPPPHGPHPTHPRLPRLPPQPTTTSTTHIRIRTRTRSTSPTTDPQTKSVLQLIQNSRAAAASVLNMACKSRFHKCAHAVSIFASRSKHPPRNSRSPPPPSPIAPNPPATRSRAIPLPSPRRADASASLPSSPAACCLPCPLPQVSGHVHRCPSMLLVPLSTSSSYARSIPETTSSSRQNPNHVADVSIRVASSRRCFPRIPLRPPCSAPEILLLIVESSR